MSSLKRDRDLAEMFDCFNRDYFRGRKPRYRVLRYPLRGCLGLCDSKRRRILIPQGVVGDGLAALLLHEMCHIGCRYHGRRFQDRLRRLISLVPPSVASQLELHLGRGREWGREDQPAPNPREIVSSCLESIAMEHPSTPWQQVRRGLIRLELPTSFTSQERRKRERVLAWARREWARLSRESLEEARFREEMIKQTTRARLAGERQATEGVQTRKKADGDRRPA